jgi:hypothetical protein
MSERGSQSATESCCNFRFADLRVIQENVDVCAAKRINKKFQDSPNNGPSIIIDGDVLHTGAEVGTRLGVDTKS